ncbi:MAG: hypothetical protein HN509_01655, partial [Halobacteriovoraceae bacterium]|nr:hypothetical protein [Halobacteriovoraceae bacterium]
VNPKDPKYAKIKDLSSLKKKAKWRYLKAFIENGKGRTLSAKGEEPAYRMVGEVGAREALVFALSKGHYFTFKELQDLRKSCHRLYDYIWDSSLLVRREIARKMSAYKLKNKKKKGVRSKVVNLSTKYRFMDQKQKYMEDLLDEKKTKLAKKANYRGNFASLFREVYFSYGERFRTCQKYVRPANIQIDRDRFWYFAYLSAYYKLESLGYIYNCGKRGWIENPVTANGVLYFSNKNELRACTTEELDNSFEEAVRVLAGLSRAGKEHHRFVEYDYGVGGSHRKVYSWVYSNGKNLKCSDDQVQRYREKQNKTRIFPLDISWRNFRFQKRGKYDLIF